MVDIADIDGGEDNVAEGGRGGLDACHRVSVGKVLSILGEKVGWCRTHCNLTNSYKVNGIDTSIFFTKEAYLYRNEGPNFVDITKDNIFY